MSPNSGRWLTRLIPETGQTQLQLICAPYAGGSSASFYPWRTYWPRNVSLYSVELPGRGNRFAEPLVTDMSEIVSSVCESLVKLDDVPYALFGHSLGAIVMFEVARRLTQSGLPHPTALVLSGQRAFHCPSPRPPIHDLDDDTFISEVKRFGGTPVALFDNAELRDVFLPVLRADFTLGETYQYVAGERLPVNIIAYGGLEDDEVSAADVKAWEEYTSGTFRSRLFPGNHFFLHQHEQLFVQCLLADLQIE